MASLTHGALVVTCRVRNTVWVAVAHGANFYMLAELLSTNPGLQKLVLGIIGLPLGLLLVLMTGMELFTGNTASMTAAVLEGRASTGALVKNWFLSYFGNLVGTLFFVWAVGVGGVVAVANPAMNVAAAKTSLTFVQVGFTEVWYHHTCIHSVIVCVGCVLFNHLLVGIQFVIQSS